MKRWLTEDMGWVMVVVILIILLIVAACLADNTQKERDKAGCLSSGRHWVLDHYETIVANGTGGTYSVYVCK